MLTADRFSRFSRACRAVSNAGGLGHLACTWRSPEQLEALFERMRRVTVRPYGANFVLDFAIDERLAVALGYGVRAISFFWADASSYVARVKSSGAVAIQVVSSIGEAKRAADAGFDLIVAQGREAGGHVRGGLGWLAVRGACRSDPTPAYFDGPRCG